MRYHLLLLCGLLFTPFFTSFGQTVSISTIRTTSNDLPPFCAESQVAITINNSGYTSGDFYVEISDKNGDFSMPTDITNAIGVNISKLVGQLPAGLPTGTGYKVRVRHSSGSYSTNESSPFAIQAKTGDPSTWGSNQWQVAVYSGRNFNEYRGYFIDNQLNIDTELHWDNANGNPSNASSYDGCSVSKDNHSYKYRRKGFSCGYYKLSVPKHDDEASLWINGTQVWSKTGACNPCSSDKDIWEGWLGTYSEVEFWVGEGYGHSHGGLTFELAEYELVAISPDVTICAGQTAFLTAISKYSVVYDWKPTTDLNITSSPTVEASPAVTTNYRVIVTETISRCQQTKFVTVTVNNLSNTQAVQNNAETCPDGTIELQATGANTYEWSPSSTLNSSTGAIIYASPLFTTVYQIIGSNGCHFSTAFVTVEVTPPAGVDDSIWGTNSWNAYVYDSRTEKTNQYYSDYSRLFGKYIESDLNIDTRDHWNNNLTPSDAATYVGCPVTEDVHEVRYKREGFPCDLYQIDVPYHDDGYALEIDGTVVASDNLWYQNNPKTNVWRGFLSNTSKVQFQYQEGWGGSGGAVNFVPIELVENDYFTFCLGETITLNVPSYTDVTYAWTGANLNSTIGATVTATPTGNTVYQVVATHTPSGCTEIGFITVEIETQTLTVSPIFTTICGGESTTLTASGATSYTWTSGSFTTIGSSVVVSPAFTTSYQVDAQFCALSFATAFVTITVGEGDPTEFGDNQWYVYGYNGRSFAQYYGRYIEPNLNFDSRNRWGTTDSPSDASGYVGCTIPKDQHSVSYKRKGFPCGYYQIDITNHDDEAWLYIDGVEIWSNTGCCRAYEDVWRGFLGTNSKIELRWGEGYGGSNGGLRFIELPDQTIITSSKNIRICETTTTTITATSPMPSSGTTFSWSKSKDDSFLSFNTTTGTTVIATANQDSEVFVTVSMHDPVSGCTFKEIFFLTIDPLPATTVNLGYKQICIGETVELEVGGANLYTWSANRSDIEAGFATATGTKNNYKIKVTPTESTTYYVEGNNNCASEFQTVVIDVQKPTFSTAEFGDGEWYVFAYEGNSFDLSKNHYRGNYRQGSIADLSFDSKTMWATWKSPSDAVGYVGCPVSNDNHFVSYKRKNFPCGWYRIHVVNHDDAMKLFVNGTEVFSATGCCKSHYGAWEGFLDENATVEFQWSEGAGGSNGSLQFEYTLSSASQTVWKGTVNTDWFNALNWCDEIPTKDINVLIPKNNVPNMPQINKAGAECNHIEISSGASLEIIGNEELEVYGDWNNNGFLTVNFSTVSFFGTANTKIEGGTYDKFYVVNLEKTSSTLSLSKNVETQYLQLTTGVIDLKNQSLSVISDAENAIVQGSEIAYIYAENQTGKLCRNLASGIGTYEFPFGKSATEFISVKIEKQALPSTQICISTWATTPNNQLAPTGVPLSVNRGGSVLNVIDRWWDISSSVNPLPNKGLNLTLSYSGSENTTPNPMQLFQIQHYDPDLKKWDVPFDEKVGGVTMGVGFAYAENVTKFSPYTIIQAPFALPVEWLYFEGIKDNNIVKLRWETSLEFNHQGFDIERSTDGQNFEQIGKILAFVPNSQQGNFYSFKDENPIFGTAYYRLRQIDTDGSESFSKIISINFQTEKIENSFQVFPNPTRSDNVQLHLKSEPETKIRLILTNILGKIVFEKFIETDKSGRFQGKVDLPQNLNTGVYQWVGVGNNGQLMHQKMILY